MESAVAYYRVSTRQQQRSGLGIEAQRATILDPFKQRRLATTACAMGLSTRQTEDLFQVLLPPGEAPDHSTIGRWVNREALKARGVLGVLDPACAKHVRTLAIDEIFFGGDRP